jgi:hypothetical protein
VSPLAEFLTPFLTVVLCVFSGTERRVIIYVCVFYLFLVLWILGDGEGINTTASPLIDDVYLIDLSPSPASLRSALNVGNKCLDDVCIGWGMDGPPPPPYSGRVLNSSNPCDV